jgi:hypothetical protein
VFRAHQKISKHSITTLWPIKEFKGPQLQNHEVLSFGFAGIACRYYFNKDYVGELTFGNGEFDKWKLETLELPVDLFQ